MLTQVDHIDLRVSNLEETIQFMEKLGLTVARRTESARSSVEMALPGDNQVIFEIRAAGDGPVGVHHIAFRQSTTGDVEMLKGKGITFKTEHMPIKATGRTVSSFVDQNGLTWQLTD